MNRWLVLLYGIACYVVFLGIFLYTAGFVGGFAPTTLDGPLRSSLPEAITVNVLLLLLFAVQHSVMARPRFKKWMTRWVPEAAERSTYVLSTNLVLALLFWQWRPLGGMVWDLQSMPARATAWGLFATGWLTVLVTTFLINHFDLFGLRQVWLHFRRRPYTQLPFGMPGPYRIVRHPLYVGWLLAFWCTPSMSMAHLLFAVGMTAYILVAIQFEERDLIRNHAGYTQYRQRVPMLIPSFRSAAPVPNPPVGSRARKDSQLSGTKVRVVGQ